MYFQKLEHLQKINGVNSFALNKLDEWLASKPIMEYDYLNPLDFSYQAVVNEDISLELFAKCSDSELFTQFQEGPLLKVKYIIGCPECDQSFQTFYSIDDIPREYSHCNDDCVGFYPLYHRERIEIYFELLDVPKTKIERPSIYKIPSFIPPLTAKHEGVKEHGLWGDVFYST